MRKILVAAALVAICMSAISCSKETKHKDRSNAKDMFERICKLTKEYTEKVADSPDSASWAAICAEFEDKLDKVNFNFPPDTDLLLSEGQNDTIYTLMTAYLEARDGRIHRILHPVIETDTVSVSDSVMILEAEAEREISQADASRSRGN